jgi:hypothetical protein
MKRVYFACLFLCLTTTFLLSQSNPVPLINQRTSVVAPTSASQTDPKAQAKILDQYGKLPLSFEANHGQADARVKFLSRTGGYSLFLTGDEAVLALSAKRTDTNKAKIAGTAHTLQSGMAEPKPGGVLRMKLRNANPAAKVTGLDELAGTSNYFIGNDPGKWRTGVPTYAKVKYEGIYSGIDLVYYGNQRQLEYDFIVAPGADPRRIQFDVRGAKRIRRDEHGDLVLKVGEGEIRWHKPVVYQEKNGARQEIAAGYAITAANRVGFEVASYDASRALYIDPLIYSSYLGGSQTDYGEGIAVDSSGDAYVIGSTTSKNFPVTPGAFQTTYGGGYYDAFVTKINATGSALVYSTYLGGSGEDVGQSIAVDGAGNAYVTGYTASTNFPTTPGAFQTNFGGPETDSDAFVTKLNPTGSSLVYSTYLGGSGPVQSTGVFNYGYGIAVDGSGDAYVTGFTSATDFPVTPGSFQTTCGNTNSCANAFVSKINPTGSALVYSTYLGGSVGDLGHGIAVDNSGNAYITGQASSPDFPVTPGSFQTTCGNTNSCANAFVSKINPTGSALVYSTYLGGSGVDFGLSIAVDSSDNAHVTGSTESSDFPTMNPLQPTYGGNGDAFVAMINPTGSALVYSTYLGGSEAEDAGTFGLAGAIAVDSLGNAYVTGYTDSTDFPITPGAFQTVVHKYGAAFVTKLSPKGSALVYSTYLGGNGTNGNGIAVDSSGDAYVTGLTSSTNFPVTPGAFQTACGSIFWGGSKWCGDRSNAFVTKMYVPAATTTTLTSLPNPSAFGEAVTFTAVVSSAAGAPPDGETITFMDGKTVLGTGALSGGSASLTTSTLKLGTSKIDAEYGGDPNFLSSTSMTVSQVVSKAATTTTLVSSQNPSSYEQPVTFTVTVAPQFSGTPTGTVTFKNGTVALETATLVGGIASYTTTKLAVGTESITAVYNGSSSFTTSTSEAVSQLVNQATTTTTLVSSLNPSTFGQSVTFTATVAPQFSGMPTGTVTFKNGTGTLGTVALSGGVAKYTTTKLAVGTESITAVYNGSSSFTTSTSTPLSQVVNQATTTTTLASSLNPSNYKQSVTFTASVTPEVSGTVTGPVTFYDGTTALKTASLSGGVAKFATSTLTSGTHTITATYHGSTSFSGSTSVPLTQTVN